MSTTKTSKSPVAAAQDVAEEAVTKIQDTFNSFRDKLEVPAAARDFVQRTAATAKERLADVHAGANNATVSYEKAFGALVNNGATVVRSLLQANYDNTVAALATIEKLASAKSFQEAYQIQSEFARDYASSNWARVQNAAETVKANVQDGVKLIQDEAQKAFAFAKKAA